ncbi:hypothetical protein RchiOBHm_Chr4g0430451 [Rosa chinensis]|uniref:Uncharacterized protein n=1 Tax=Rosa chinensis TaxID=74649 RepID=A0A2P6R0G3_ROSCH|nr:hypothetical protein RchiOBHm_Chr4g0430451 [Rosa chinensis]
MVPHRRAVDDWMLSAMEAIREREQWWWDVWSRLLTGDERAVVTKSAGGDVFRIWNRKLQQKTEICQALLQSSSWVYFNFFSSWRTGIYIFCLAFY